jgi:hypothetical protein
LLLPGSLSGLTDNVGGDWVEANPLETGISELNPAGSVVVNVGNSFGVGNIYDRLAAVPPSEEDLAFQYATPDGRLVDGLVQFTGPANDLVLKVDPLTGAGQFEYLSDLVDPLDLIGYSITSQSGALSPEDWSSFSDSGLAGTDWTEANPMMNALSELNPESSVLFDTGTIIPVGNLFTVGGNRDLVLEIATAGGLRRLATVEYGELATVGTPGDGDGDGDVDLVDFTALKDIFGTTEGSPEFNANYDFDDSGDIGLPDFNVLKDNFGAQGEVVPEPGTWALMLLGLAGFLGRARISRKRA